MGSAPAERAKVRIGVSCAGATCSATNCNSHRSNVARPIVPQLIRGNPNFHSVRGSKKQVQGLASDCLTGFTVPRQRR